jgi:hypothetical protein
MIPKKHRHVTGIYSSDFEGFVSEVSADLWNKLMDEPAFQTLKPGDYANLYEVVARVMSRYRQEHRP